MAERRHAEEQLADAELAIGSALINLLAEGVTATQAGDYCELPPSEVHRLVRRAQSTPQRATEVDQ